MGGAGGADMLGTMLMMEAMRGGNSGGGGGGGAGGPPGQGPPGQGGFHSNIASMLGDSGSGKLIKEMLELSMQHSIKHYFFYFDNIVMLINKNNCSKPTVSYISVDYF